MTKSLVNAVILAGGSGTRLWPYSRISRPKQFLSFNGQRTMLQETVQRVLPLIPPERILVATSVAYADLVAEQLPELPPEAIACAWGEVRSGSGSAVASAPERVDRTPPCGGGPASLTC